LKEREDKIPNLTEKYAMVVISIAIDPPYKSHR